MDSFDFRSIYFSYVWPSVTCCSKEKVVQDNQFKWLRLSSPNSSPEANI